MGNTIETKKRDVKMDIHVPYLDQFQLHQKVILIKRWLKRIGDFKLIQPKPVTKSHEWISEGKSFRYQVSTTLEADELALSWCDSRMSHRFGNLILICDDERPVAAKTQLSASLEFGTFVGPNEYVSASEEGTPTEHGVTVRMEASSGENTFLFYLKTVDGQLYCMELREDAMFKSIIIDANGPYTMYLHVKHRPLVYKLADKSTGIDLDSAKLSAGALDWRRHAGLPNITSEVIGTSDVIKVCLGCSSEEVKQLIDMLHAGVWSYSYAIVKDQTTGTKIQTIADMVDCCEKTFHIEYLLNMMYSRGLKAQVQLSITSTFVKYLLNDDVSLVEQKEEAVSKLIEICDHNPKWHMINWDLVNRDLVSHNIARSSKRNGKSYSARYIWIRCATLTPTRILLDKAQGVDSSRILRDNDADSFLRVSFRDENLSSTLDTVKSGDSFIRSVVGNRLNDGLTIAGRNYRYLAQSNSQLKQHRCYLYASDSHRRSATDLRRGIGDLDAIRCVAKHVARLGMAFTQTTEGSNLSGTTVRYDDDILRINKDDGKEYNFSDGIGRISEESANMLDSKVRCPSAYQIRHGGDKGVLARDPNLKGKCVVFRKSMNKFGSGHHTLDVCNHSMAKRLYLNHQIVTLLSQLGVPDRTFFAMQSKEIEDTLRSLLDEEKTMAVLRRTLSAILPINGLEQIGCKVNCVPFLRQLLISKIKQDLYSIKKSARIPINESKGRNMMGALDETGTLNYGEVFIQYSATIRSSKTHIVHKGQVVVSKMPALHPGDVRKLFAIDVPTLYHMKNVIVFPQKGPRPHPDEMSGSDLDGDEYWVCWDPELIPPRDNCAPMNYSSRPEKVQDRPVTERDMLEFIESYIQSDIAPIISRSHLILANSLPDGIFSEECLELAKLHSRAIDANKTGEKIDLPNNLHSKNAPEFLEKSDHKPSERSESILGKLFRRCRNVYNAVEAEQRRNVSLADVRGADLMVPGTLWTISRSNVYTESVRRIYDDYLGRIEYLLQKYDIQTEVHLFTGYVYNSTIRKNTIFDLQNEIKDSLKNLKNDIRRALSGLGTKEEHGEIAKACFVVAHVNSSGNGQGFPWLVVDWFNPGCPSGNNTSIYRLLGEKCISCIGIDSTDVKEIVKQCVQFLDDDQTEIALKNPCVFLVYIVCGGFPDISSEGANYIWKIIVESARQTKSPFLVDLELRQHTKGWFNRISDMFISKPRQALSLLIKLCEDKDPAEAELIGQVYTMTLFALFREHLSDEGCEEVCKAVVGIATRVDVTRIPEIAGCQRKRTQKTFTDEEIITETVILTTAATAVFQDSQVIHELEGLLQYVYLDHENRKLIMKGSKTRIENIKSQIEVINKKCPEPNKPDIRNNHSVTSRGARHTMECYNCHEKGHFARECPRSSTRKMDNSSRTVRNKLSNKH